jgi:hypothetical protein
MLGHEAVVMGARHARRFTEIGRHPFAQCWRRGTRSEIRVALVRIEQTAHGLAARGAARRWGPWILEIGFEFNRLRSRSEKFSGDAIESPQAFGRQESRYHHVTLVAHRVDLRLPLACHIAKTSPLKTRDLTTTAISGWNPLSGGFRYNAVEGNMNAKNTVATAARQTMYRHPWPVRLWHCACCYRSDRWSGSGPECSWVDC